MSRLILMDSGFHTKVEALALSKLGYDVVWSMAPEKVIIHDEADLRDQFAMGALTHYLSVHEEPLAAKLAYVAADAMLRARGESR